MEPLSSRIQFKSMSFEGKDPPIISRHFEIKEDNLFGQKIEICLKECKANKQKANISISPFCDSLILDVLAKYRDRISCLDLSQCSAVQLLDPSTDNLAYVIDKIDKVILPSDCPAEISSELNSKIMDLRAQSLPKIIVNQKS